MELNYIYQLIQPEEAFLASLLATIEDKTMFEITGRGVFIGEADVALGMAFADKLRNEGFAVRVTEQHNLFKTDNVIDKKTYVVEFGSESNNYYF